MIRLDGGLARAGIGGFSIGSETNIAVVVAIRSLGRCGSPFNKRSILLRGMVLTDNTDTEPFSLKDDRRLPTDSYRFVLGLKADGQFSSSRVCAMCPAGRLFEYRVES